MKSVIQITEFIIVGGFLYLLLSYPSLCSLFFVM